MTRTGWFGASIGSRGKVEIFNFEANKMSKISNMFCVCKKNIKHSITLLISAKNRNVYQSCTNISYYALLSDYLGQLGMLAGSVGIDLKELPKCLKFCPRIEI